MQPLRFTRALALIVTELRAQEILDLLRPFILKGDGANHNIAQETKDNFAALVFASRAGYERLTLDPDASRLLGLLQLGSTYEVPRLNKMLTLFTSFTNSANIWGSVDAFYSFASFFIELQELLRFSLTTLTLLQDERTGGTSSADGEATDTLELYLIDYDNSGVELPRLGQFVTSYTQLYGDFARLLGVRADAPRIRYVDSGSDVVFGIQAAKLVIDAIRVFLTEFWSKVRFRSHEQFSKNLDAIGQSMDVMSKIQQSVDAKVIDAETGALLKKRILLEADQLLGIGVALTPIEAIEVIDERQLLLEQRDVKLLGPGDTPDGQSSVS